MATPLENIQAMPETTVEEMQAKIAALSAYNTKRPKGTLELKVSEKGAISVLGLQRFPVTLYAPQWQRLLADEVVIAIHQFIDDNRDSLSFEKPERVKTEPYDEATKTADWKLIHGQTAGTPEQVAFATKRYNEYEQKRFGSK